jgi:hypothetical protein
MSGLSAQERADGWGRRRFPGEDIKPVLGSRLINIEQIGMGPTVASIPSGVPNPPAYPKRLADPGRNYRGRGHHGGGLSELPPGEVIAAPDRGDISNPRRCLMLNASVAPALKSAGDQYCTAACLSTPIFRRVPFSRC